jgi:nucleotide-binding universal stress UspA family protein
MKISFNNILVPVDFSLNTQVAIRKALSLCEGTDTAIHLLHVSLKPAAKIFSIREYFSRNAVFDNQPDVRISQQRLEKFRSTILSIRPEIEIIASTIVRSSIEEGIIDHSKNINADLIVVGKNSHHSWLPFLNTVFPATIAKRSGIAVLTVRPGAINDSIRTVVVPVGDGFPYKKVAAINALKAKFRFQTRLVTFRTSHKDPVIVPVSLLNAYRILKNNPDTQVSYDILYGNNRAKAILAYCSKVNADLLILNPETEMKVGWMNKQIQDVMPTHSKTQILAVLQN